MPIDAIIGELRRELSVNRQETELQVTGYHGTSSAMADIIEREGFRLSRNDYDWLGDGVYFFQDGLLRAWQWARERHGDDAAVIGADIRLVDCMDLLDVGWNEILSNAHDEYISLLEKIGRAAPIQTEGVHSLDRDVINYAVDMLARRGARVACVRAAFQEGRPVYPDSAFYNLSHVQIAVREPGDCIRRIWREGRAS